MVKAVHLYSGGLDSILAACLIKQQGIEIIAIHFISPFFGNPDKAAISARGLGLDFIPIHLEQDYLEMLKSPVYGYGKNFNPCIDCHAFMFRKAGAVMEEMGASFIISGEVLGQRPMSQNKNALQAVDKISGYKGLIVRPLSARLLPETIPAREDWIDIEKLGSISGRSRKPQMEMAVEFGIGDYPSPAGGCRLTQENYGKRLRQYLGFKPQSSLNELGILGSGRHFMLDDHSLLVVGRNQADNKNIASQALEGDILVKTQERPGPLGLLRNAGGAGDQTRRLAAAVVAAYSDTRDLELARVRLSSGGIQEFLEVAPLDRALLPPSL